MSSTRLKNDPSEYVLEQYTNKGIRYNRTQLYRTTANKTVMPNLGIYPSHMPKHVLATNATDIESDLFGIHSTDLLNPRKPCTPDIKISSFPYQAYFQRDLEVLMPRDLILENDQRPIIP